MKKISDNSMWRGASSTIFSKAAKLRNETTQPETLLWSRLRENRLLGYKFRRQHPISIYIDFFASL
jgi:very-short-patch-repair endonuclease